MAAAKPSKKVKHQGVFTAAEAERLLARLPASAHVPDPKKMNEGGGFARWFGSPAIDDPAYYRTDGPAWPR